MLAADALAQVADEDGYGLACCLKSGGDSPLPGFHLPGVTRPACLLVYFATIRQ